MWQWVFLIGAVVCAGSLFLIARPAQLRGLLERVFATRWLYAAALMRLLLGALLIGSAPSVAFPAAVALCGWLFALGGLGLVVIPAPLLLRIADWFSALSPLATRLWLIVALSFGLFLVYAALA